MIRWRVYYNEKFIGWILAATEKAALSKLVKSNRAHIASAFRVSRDSKAR